MATGLLRISNPFRGPFGNMIKERPLRHGGANRAIALGLAAVTLPALYRFYQVSETAYAAPLDTLPPLPPMTQDALARHQRAKELYGTQGHGTRYLHPEHRFPELYKPAFGRVHMRKRVDGPPDRRNHRDLMLRNQHL